MGILALTVAAVILGALAIVEGNEGHHSSSMAFAICSIMVLFASLFV